MTILIRGTSLNGRPVVMSYRGYIKYHRDETNWALADFRRFTNISGSVQVSYCSEVTPLDSITIPMDVVTDQFYVNVDQESKIVSLEEAAQLIKAGKAYWICRVGKSEWQDPKIFGIY